MPTDLTQVDLTTVAKLAEFTEAHKDDPAECMRASFYYLRERERRYTQFEKETIEIVKKLVRHVAALEKLLKDDGEGEEPQKAAQEASPQPQGGGSPYPPVNNLPFPTSAAEAAAKGKAAPTQPGGTVTSVESNTGSAPAPAEGQNNSQVVGVSPIRGKAPAGVNNSRVTSVSPIPKTADGGPVKV